jgi:hypothetical protein
MNFRLCGIDWRVLGSDLAAYVSEIEEIQHAFAQIAFVEVCFEPGVTITYAETS